MNSPVLDIKNLLVLMQYVYFVGDTPQNPHNLPFGCVLNFETDTPVSLVTMYDTGGSSLFKTFGGSQNDRETFQLRCRGLTYQVVYDKLHEIKVYLDGLGKFAPPGQSYRYEGFYRVSPILPLGKDDNNRWLASVNYSTIRMIG